MRVFSPKFLRAALNPSAAGLFFLAGLWLVVLRPMGSHLAWIPGDLGDVRFNNYILEHFFRWLNGLDRGYWSPGIFYPFPNTVTFSDNLLGSAPFYGLFRWAGLDRETAYQAWYILGFGLNYFAAFTVLSRARLNSLAAAAGAFYFAFGLPILAQENHPQLLYRFPIPLACFFLWKYARSPRFLWLIALAGMAVWQCYLGIYNGVFLFFLLVFMILLVPFGLPARSSLERLKFWPRQLKLAWLGASPARRTLTVLGLAGLGLCAGVLFRPYFQAAKLYGFSRSWTEVSSMLPRWRSYLLGDNVFVWKSISASITGIPVRGEQQLFPGLVALFSLVLLAWVFWRLETESKGFVLLHFGALACLVALTLDFKGGSLYRPVWELPGINSIRAVSRIILVMMWPLAVLVGFGIDALWHAPRRIAPVLIPAALLLSGLLIFEPASYNHMLFAKAETQTRLAALRQQIPARLPPDPVLIVASQAGPWWASEIDAMLLGQDLGWPIFNGYSGNRPPAYGPTGSCALLPQRILAYLSFARSSSPEDYFHLIGRAVPIGFDDCDPAWWQKMPSLTSARGALPLETFKGVQLKVESLTLAGGQIRARVSLANPSAALLPALSSTHNPVHLAWRLVNLDGNTPAPGFDARKNLHFDLPPSGSAFTIFPLDPPAQAGQYRLEVTLVQEGIGWFQDYGMQAARSEQVLSLDAEQQVQISPPGLP